MTRVLVVPSALATGWLVGALPLLLAGVYRPLPAALVCTPVALLAAAAAWRLTAGARPAAWPLALTLLVAVGFGVLTWVSGAQQVIVRRDPGTYALGAVWVAQHGRLPVPAHPEVFGDAPGLTVGSPGFYARGDHVVPQFMTGPALLSAPAYWAGGVTGLLHANAVIGACALLAVAGVAAAVGTAWTAPLAAVAAGGTYPLLRTSSTMFSEPAALLLMFGGLALVLTAARRRPAGAALAGLVLGMSTLVRVDAYADLLPLVPMVGVLAVVTGRSAAAFAAGTLGGMAFGLVDGLVVTRPYWQMLDAELAAVGGAAAVLAVGTVVLARRRRLPEWAARHGPELAAGLVAVGAVLLAARPLLFTVHEAHTGYTGFVVDLQSAQGLDVDRGRTYAEQSMVWVAWWLGPVALALGVAGLALLVRRALRAADRWLLTVLAVLLGATALLLWRPAITPDHPWADRRFVPVVLPALVVGGAWLVTRLVGLVRRHAPRRTARLAVGAVAVLGLLALAGPPALASAPLATERTQVGELSLLDRVCAALPPRAAVVLVGTRARLELTQALRWRCGLPAAALRDATQAELDGVAASIRRHGRTPVLLSLGPDPLRELGHPGTRVAYLVTREDARLLTRRPSHPQPLRFDVWLARLP